MTENLSIQAVEGEQVRINIVFDATLDPTAFQVYGGNTTCPHTPVQFTSSIAGQTVTLTSNVLPYICQPLPFQIFVKRLADGAEWVPATGSIKTARRLVNE